MGSERIIERMQDGRAIPHERYRSPHDLVDGGRIDIDVHDLRARTELVQSTRDAIIESCSDTYDQVGVMHGKVGLEGAMHAQHAEPLRARGRIGAKPHQGQRARRARKLG